MRPRSESPLKWKYVKGCGFVDKAKAKSSIDFTHKSTSTTAATTIPPEPQDILQKVYICIPNKIVRWSERTIN